MRVLRDVLFRVCSCLTYRFKAVNSHGLHSPFLFDFYNEVIAPKKEFYFFTRFRAILPAYGQFISERDALFLYRWTAFYKPDSVSLISVNFPASVALSIPTNLKTLSVSSLRDYTEKEHDLLASEGVLIHENIPTEMCFCEEINDLLMTSLSDYKCVIIYKPHQNKAKDAIWNELCSSNEVSISIDLFQFGILLIEKNQAKQHFVVRMS